MKRSLTLLGLLLTIHFFTYSQDEPKIMLGGNTNINFSNQQINNVNWKFVDLSINLKLGFFVSPHSLLGIETGVNYTKERDYDGYGYMENTSYLISVFYRYQNLISGNFGYYIEPGAGKQFFKNSDLNYFITSLDFGFLYFISKKISIELKLAGIDYNIHSIKDSDFKVKEFHINYGLVTPNFGIKYYF